MKHEIKPGVLVLLKAGGNNPRLREFVGQIHMVGQPISAEESYSKGAYPVRHWRFDPPVWGSNGWEVVWSEPNLQVLDNPGDDEKDEISFREPEPLQVNGWFTSQFSNPFN